jgi:hypothetical protein
MKVGRASRRRCAVLKTRRGEACPSSSHGQDAHATGTVIHFVGGGNLMTRHGHAGV